MPLANQRKAFASKGDDATLTRFVKLPGRHKSERKVIPMPEDAEGTRFKNTIVWPSDQLISPSIKTQLTVSGHSNVKLGRDVRKGALKGYWIFTLSFEERATCPRNCAAWEICYGNAMPFAKRVDHTDPYLLDILEAEIARLVGVKGRVGVLMRLHELGDFLSVEYISFWRRMLDTHPTLALFGYTAHLPTSHLGTFIGWLNRDYPGRSFIRFSNGGLETMSTVMIQDEAECPANAFICPEQTDKTTCCATCGACWGTPKNVAFLEH